MEGGNRERGKMSEREEGREGHRNQTEEEVNCAAENI